VTGALPGYGKAPIDVIRMHLDDEIRPPSSINPRVPDELERIIMKLLEKDPRHRYVSAAAFLHEIAGAAGRTAPAGELLVGKGELYAAPLIGRKHEVGELMSLIAEARQGRGSGAILAGVEGMGKTRIVRDATLRAQLDGARVFCGRCPINRKSIYAPFFQIFEQMVTAVNPAADVAAEIRRLLRPVVSAANGEEAAPSTGQKYRLYNRIVQSMQDMYGFLSAAHTSGSPLILVIEDLQWADPSTEELFTFLVGEARQNKLLVIGTLTIDPNADGGGNQLLASWEQRARDANFPLLRVESLNEPMVREHLQSLLGEQNVSDEFVRWMLWESAGSPLNIRRVIDYLIAHDYLRWQPTGWVADLERLHGLRIPGGAASILMERVDALAANERAVLEAAAVFGEVSDVDVLTRAGRPDPGRAPGEETYIALRAVIEHGLLDESSDGKTVTFPQIHLRDAIYNAMTERRREELHQRAANALEPALAAGAQQLLGQVAFHFARANDAVQGIRNSVEAGDLSMRTVAPQEATEF
jgi:predicted ATPase